VKVLYQGGLRFFLGEIQGGLAERNSLVKLDGVAKSPPYGVTAFFQDLDIPDVCLRP
jgi:hypothetical protein